jgi:hypothetical protein
LQQEQQGEGVEGDVESQLRAISVKYFSVISLSFNFFLGGIRV